MHPARLPDSAGKPVDPDAIAAELRALWRELGASESSGVTRALMLNFVLHVAPGGDLVAASRTVARVTAALPSRAFVLVESDDRDDGAALEAWISSHCVLGGHGKQVCCEQITLRARRDAGDALAAQLLSLLVPDLPTVLWWPDGDIESRLLARIAREVDRLIIDSAAFTHAETGLRALAALAERGTATATTVDDVAWARLDAWRELTACPFDGPPFDRLLPTLRSARIVHTAHGAAQAWLFAGWLASRLGWRARRRRDCAFECDTTHGSGELRLEAAPDRAGDGRPDLLHVRLLAADATAFDVEIDSRHPTLLAARVERPSTCPRPQHRDRHSADRDDEIVGVLQRRRPNRAFVEALAAAARLCEMPA